MDIGQNLIPAGRVLWKGVVAIERPDPARSAHTEQPMCKVMSARTMAGGRRAILVDLPYTVLRDKFRLEDGDSVYHYAELIGEHLEIYERASQRDFFLHTEQSSLAH